MPHLNTKNFSQLQVQSFLEAAMRVELAALIHSYIMVILNSSCSLGFGNPVPRCFMGIFTKEQLLEGTTLQGTNISRLETRKIIDSKVPNGRGYVPIRN